MSSSYRYDGAGQRIAKVSGGNTEVYVLDGASTLGVITVNESGTPVFWHFNVLADDRVIGRQPNVGSRKYYHTDLLGSTRAVVEGTAIVESYDPEPWGLLMPGRTLGSGTKEGFTGKEQDAESGLDYFGARMYMPALGRWTSIDPVADNFPAWSPYNFTLNNPLSSIDPTGRETIVLTGAAAQAAFSDVKTWPKERSKPVARLLQRMDDWLHEYGRREAERMLAAAEAAEEAEEAEESGTALSEGNTEFTLDDAMILVPGSAGGGGRLASGVARRLVSRIGNNPTLSKLASKISGTLQKSIDDLTARLAAGNMNPGTHTKHLTGTADVFYARARDGARVFFRQVGDTIEIVGKATKQSEQRVINVLLKIYGK